MKILLTGGSGQVGTEIRRRVHRWDGLTVIAPTRAELDLARPGEVAVAVHRYAPDIVINAGAYTAVDKAESEPDLAEAVNARAPGELAKACAARHVPVLHFSTDYVFPGDAEHPYRPEDATAPLGVYGATKLAGERALRAGCPQHLIFRISWVFAGHGANFVRTMLRLGAQRDELRIVADQVGGPTYAGHIADAALHMVDRYRRDGTLAWGTYHYAGAPDVSWYAFAGEIFARAVAAGILVRAPRLVPIATAEYPTPARRPLNSRMDCSATASVLGLPRPDWRVGLDLALAELRTS